AALELEEVDDERYNTDTGIQQLLDDLEISFGERELFRLYERKLKDAQVPPYPDETRAFKLLDGLRLDERATSQLLLAAGNRYSFQALVEAIHIQYPAGLTLTGMSRHPVFMTAGDEAQQYEDDPNDDTFDYQFADYDEQAEDYTAAPEEFEPDELPEAGDDAGDEHQAMTATSKRLAATVQSRGYYTTVKDKGKGKGHGKGAGKDKGFGKKGATSSSSPTTTSEGKGSGKSKAGSKGGKSKMNPTQRQRMQASLCLGCGASDHWLQECPHVTQHQAHVCSASSTLDGDGAVVWMTSHNKMPGWQPESPPSSSAPSTLSRRDEEEPPPPPPRRELPAEDALPPWDALIPEGMNPDDHADYEDGMAFWRHKTTSR
ncbi:Retrovirus-related Pol polyprotein from transposon TNT 1-94, partial [Durusdinium trenchii]